MWIMYQKHIHAVPNMFPKKYGEAMLGKECTIYRSWTLTWFYKYIDIACTDYCQRKAAAPVFGWQSLSFKKLFWCHSYS